MVSEQEDRRELRDGQFGLSEVRAFLLLTFFHPF